MPPFLNTYEYCFGDSGFVLNTNSQGIPFVDITDIAGLDSAPIRTSTTEHIGIDGAYQDASYMTMRTIAITGTVYDNAATPEALLDTLRAQYGPGTYGQFFFKHPGSPLRFVNAMGGGVKYDVDTQRRLGITNVVITLFCPDPYFYDFQPINPAFTAQPLVTQINANADFETGTTPWQPTNSALLTSSPNALTGAASLQITPSGTIATPGASSEFFPVIGGGRYTLQASVFTIAAYSSVQIGINWYTSAQAFISSSFSGLSTTTAGSWLPLTYNPPAAPANAAFGVMYLQMTGTPPSSTLFWWDAAVCGAAVGLGFPVSFNTGFGGPLIQLNNTVQVTHNGTHTAYPVFTLKGPLTNPVITDTLTRQTMKLTITLASTDTLVVDCRYKSIILNDPDPIPGHTHSSGPTLTSPGGVNARSVYQGLFWFSVPPFGSDTFAIAHDVAASTNGQLRVTLLGTYY
jgi:hypothetical protein